MYCKIAWRVLKVHHGKYLSFANWFKLWVVWSNVHCSCCRWLTKIHNKTLCQKHVFFYLQHGYVLIHTQEIYRVFKYIASCLLLAPTGALIVTVVYYRSAQLLFEILSIFANIYTSWPLSVILCSSHFFRTSQGFLSRYHLSQWFFNGFVQLNHCHWMN